MRTKYSDRYIVLGLKIAYYRKKAGFTQEVFAEKIGKSLNFLGQVEGPAQSEVFRWKHYSRSQMFSGSLLRGCWKMISFFHLF